MPLSVVYLGLVVILVLVWRIRQFLSRKIPPRGVLSVKALESGLFDSINTSRRFHLLSDYYLEIAIPKNFEIAFYRQ